MEAMKKHKVFLADDHVVMREGIAAMVNSLGDYVVTGSADNGLQIFENLKEQAMPDILILDLSMPVMDGFEASRKLSKEYPDLKVLILTMYDSEIALIRLLQDGVKGFLKKDIRSRELRIAMDEVLAGGYYYGSQTTGKLGNMFHNHYVNNIPFDRSILSDREIMFLKYCCSHLTYKEIAKMMNLSPRVVDCCRDVLFEKLDAKNRVCLAMYAIKHGIVQL